MVIGDDRLPFTSAISSDLPSYAHLVVLGRGDDLVLGPDVRDDRDLISWILQYVTIVQDSQDPQILFLTSRIAFSIVTPLETLHQKST